MLRCRLRSSFALRRLSPRSARPLRCPAAHCCGQLRLEARRLDEIAAAGAFLEDAPELRPMPAGNCNQCKSRLRKARAKLMSRISCTSCADAPPPPPPPNARRSRTTRCLSNDMLVLSPTRSGVRGKCRTVQLRSIKHGLQHMRHGAVPSNFARDRSVFCSVAPGTPGATQLRPKHGRSPRR